MAEPLEKKANWQHRGKPIWAAEIWQDIVTQIEKLTVKVRHLDAHVSKSQANEEHHNNEQVDKAASESITGGSRLAAQGRSIPSPLGP
ncbi:hypothetical protein DUI87_31757 [Hirundo rustica rustica]|uniref:RNase H type-1 domain-containing protein n=1 Tax=Hirundo rustica rustica TaxID=333673 RepID=A0A3M0IZ91_HIRRU|nr:hypothetical protein DUI87_31757 [Hirundo rustica rustica]